MDTISKAIKTLSDAIEKICEGIGILSVAAFVVVISLQVVCRNFLKISMVWANDISVVCFVWAVFLGSAIAVRHRAHYVLAFLPERFEKSNCFLDIVGDIARYHLLLCADPLWLRLYHNGPETYVHGH